MSASTRQLEIHCERCGRVQPKRSRWRKLCASCRKREQGREVTPPQRRGPGQRKGAQR